MSVSVASNFDFDPHPLLHIALFVFTTKDAAEKFVEDDPYVSNGIVTGHSISEWTVGVGTN